MQLHIMYVKQVSSEKYISKYIYNYQQSNNSQHIEIKQRRNKFVIQNDNLK